jgi:pyruvate dehydrogenase E1 component beta subunit
LLKAAIRDDNPVIFIEHRGLYWSKGEVPDGEHIVRLGTASVVREGTDLTIVALGTMIAAAQAAAGELSASGVEMEIIDSRSVSPLDVQTIVHSVKKTGRLIVAHEAVGQGGIGAEITAAVQEHALYYLDAPILRVTSPFAPVPASPALEKEFLPGQKRIVESVKKLFGHA